MSSDRDENNDRDDVVARFRRALARCAIEARARILVAVSGGVDSMSLLALCLLLRDEGMFEAVSALHINHRLRPAAETEADYHVVRNYCAKAGIALHYRAVEAGEHQTRQAGEGEGKRERQTAQAGERQTRQAGGIEAMARRARLRQYAAVLKELGLRYLFAAHHRDDNIETIMMRMLQGSGVNGLAAMPYARAMTTDGYSYRIIRPLLGIEKQALRRWVRAADIPFREDATNRDTALLRNAVRHEVMPAIARHFPRYHRAMERIMHQIDTWRDYIERQHRRALVWQFVGRRARIDAESFFAAHPALQFQSFYATVDRLRAAADTDGVPNNDGTAIAIADSAQTAAAHSDAGRLPYRFARHCLQGYPPDYHGNRGDGYGIRCHSDSRYLYIERQAAVPLERHSVISIGAPNTPPRALDIRVDVDDRTVGSRLFRRLRAPIIIKLTERKYCTTLSIYDMVLMIMNVTIKNAPHCTEGDTVGGWHRAATRVFYPHEARAYDAEIRAAAAPAPTSALTSAAAAPTPSAVLTSATPTATSTSATPTAPVLSPSPTHPSTPMFAHTVRRVTCQGHRMVIHMEGVDEQSRPAKSNEQSRPAKSNE